MLSERLKNFPNSKYFHWSLCFFIQIKFISWQMQKLFLADKYWKQFPVSICKSTGDIFNSKFNMNSQHITIILKNTLYIPGYLVHFSAQAQKIKNFTLKKFLHFLKRKPFWYFRKWNSVLFSTGLKNKKNSSRENFLYFRKWKPWKKFFYFLLYFLEGKFSLYSRKGRLSKLKKGKISYVLGNRTFLYFRRITKWKLKTFYTFSYKEAQFSKLKYFLIII